MDVADRCLAAYLEYVPTHRRGELVTRPLSFCDRLIVGITEELLPSFGFAISGRSERRHRHPDMAYRLLSIDA